MGLGRFTLRRDPGLPLAPEDDFARRLSLQVTASLAREFSTGFCHGARTTLLLLLGEATDGAPPFPGPLTPEVERWAREALARLEQL